MGSVDREGPGKIIRGLEDLRGGIRLYLISVLILIVGSLFILTVITAPLWIPGGPSRITKADVMAILILAILLVLAVSVIMIFGTIKLRDGMEVLARIYKDADIGFLGARLILYGIILVVAGILTLLIVIGAVLAVVGVLVMIVGNILFGLGIINLDKYTREDLRTPGILYIIGVAAALVGGVLSELSLLGQAISLLGQALELAGLIVLYMRLGGWIEELKTSTPAGEAKPPTWGM
ncbi:MAG: DUF973 family protein [Desulfurococcales archaeon]|nr:DUF973 family protein [Desulfurococcales archaeon]